MLSKLSPPQTISVLIVEDEYVLARNLKEELETVGYTVVGIADTGEAAINTAISQQPDIVLMDIRIRGERDGIHTAEQIWRQLRIPVIYVTGHSDQKTVERATLSLPFGYIVKPVRLPELSAAIQTALTRRQQEQFLETVLQGMGDGVTVADDQLHITYLNQAAQALTGWTLEAAKECLVTEVMPLLDEDSQCPIEHPLLTAQREETTIYLTGKTLLVRQDGSTLPVADSAAALKNNEGAVTGSVMVFRDDTPRRLLEERDHARERAQLAEAQLAEQQQLNRLKDDFLASTSHELRTPLSNIKLAICLLETVLNQQGLLKAATATQAQSVNQYLAILQDQCSQELQLVNDLLELRSLEAKAYPLTLTTIHLQEFLPHTAESFHARATVQQQTLHVNIPAALAPILSDRPALTRIVSELLNNACKYTPVGGVIEVTAALVAAAPTPAIQLMIRNSGVEIAPDQQARIFEPFYRIPQSDPWKHGGTGLGLALVKKLTEHLQGTITVTSAPGWTLFTIQLPVKQ